MIRLANSIFTRLILIVLVAGAAHLSVALLRRVSGRLLRSRLGSEAKALTITSFLTSVFVFTVYFAAVGFLLAELGVPLTTYLASASVIGLAVSFGSQGIVQDVITGLTVVFADLVDVGDMVDIGGQVGIVEKVGMRFTVLVNFFGARVFVPNRSIVNVTSYPKGYVRAFLDTRLPDDKAKHELAKARIWEISCAAYEQHPGVLLMPPSQEGCFRNTRRLHPSANQVSDLAGPGQGHRGVRETIRHPVSQEIRRDLHRLDGDRSLSRRAEWQRPRSPASSPVDSPRGH